MTKNLLQKIIDIIYRYPTSYLRKFNRFGGLLNYQRIKFSEKAMIKAAKILPPVKSFPTGYPIHFLTGKKFIHQTLFCIHSLAKHNTNEYKFILVDDGTFDRKLLCRIKLQLPGVEIIETKTIEANLAKKLPQDKYPNINLKRQVYPHLKKLTDIHTLNSNEYKLVLDSDMLFWDKSPEIENWLRKPTDAICIQDCQQSYGYRETTMEKLTGADIPDMINVGLIGLKSDSINWDDIELWIGELENSEGTSYFLEQALTAMILSKKKVIILNKTAYIVNPDNKAIACKQGILHHYVDLSKEFYLKKAWRIV
ncbi:hypothetical protein ABIB40_003588 [Pedobacter sp. UYP30]|uniref:hypothetical protein n=1 Tax=Pedobacter sp. UYP30 TaxID=1756400 RepID=UPI0033962E39